MVEVPGPWGGSAPDERHLDAPVARLLAGAAARYAAISFARAGR
jgi:hypothetical protein